MVGKIIKIIDPSLYIIYKIKTRSVRGDAGQTLRASVLFHSIVSDPKEVEVLRELGWSGVRVDKDFKVTEGTYIDIWGSM